MSVKPNVVHEATPQENDEYHCAVCGQRIKKVPGGHGSTFVHKDSGAVAAPNPPLTADHIHVLLDVLGGEPEPWTGYDTEPEDDPKASRSGWNQLRSEAKATLESILGGMSTKGNQALSLSYAQVQCRAMGHVWLVPGLPFDTPPEVLFELAKQRGEPIRADCQNSCGMRKVYHADHSISYEHPA